MNGIIVKKNIVQLPYPREEKFAEVLKSLGIIFKKNIPGSVVKVSLPKDYGVYISNVSDNNRMKYGYLINNNKERIADFTQLPNNMTSPQDDKKIDKSKILLIDNKYEMIIDESEKKKEKIYNYSNLYYRSNHNGQSQALLNLMYRHIEKYKLDNNIDINVEILTKKNKQTGPFEKKYNIESGSIFLN